MEEVVELLFSEDVNFTEDLPNRPTGDVVSAFNYCSQPLCQ